MGGRDMILATNNKGKLREIKDILNEYEIKSLDEAGIDIDVVEDQDSFYGNALKKAKEIYEIAKEPVIADDSGLCILVYNGWPGVMTHRFVGEDATDDDRNNAILDKMVGESNRTAQVVCNLVYYDGSNEVVGKGVLDGIISLDRRGTNGFGFDDIFELLEGRTLAELTSEEKNTISARRLAAEDLKEKLREIKNI
ncbi:MAG TPA: non-canonical purine NTP pyrophosphatase, RdgB/HAM1 family [Firmicutes bacterium]|nr:non-canonical purine NTP pyrophosphatase, RdgB/HAM1 family [Bacillota bacterium]